MSVYFAQRGNLIKIGYSATPKRRADALGARLLGTISGGRRMERLMHHRFRDYREHGEWFHLGVDLITFCEAMIEEDVAPGARSTPRYRAEMERLAASWRESDRLAAQPVVVFS